MLKMENKGERIDIRLYDYDEDSVFVMTGLCDKRTCVIYARVSTQNQKKDLTNQIETTNYQIYFTS